MSKAFVKEDDGGDLADEFDSEISDPDDDSDPSAGTKIPGGNRNYITFKGLEALKAELHQLAAVERPKVVEVVAWAAGNGDRSENADYQYGKRRLREIDRRLHYLQKRIDSAEAVDPQRQIGKKILFGATVTVGLEDGGERTYRIVGVDEVDVKNGKVSWKSPVGQALLQAAEGDVVLLNTPRGEQELEVLRVEFVEID